MSPSQIDLTGRTALVTGSSRSIGRALAEGLAEAGATVVLNGINPHRLAQTESELTKRFGAARVRSRAFDVTDEIAVTAAVDWVEEHLTPLDIRGHPPPLSRS